MDMKMNLEPLNPGVDSISRASAYAAWLHAAIDDEERCAIRRHLAQERALGDPRFQQMVEKALNHPVTFRPRGRPKVTRGEAVD